MSQTVQYTTYAKTQESHVKRIKNTNPNRITNPKPNAFSNFGGKMTVFSRPY